MNSILLYIIHRGNQSVDGLHGSVTADQIIQSVRDGKISMSIEIKSSFIVFTVRGMREA